MRVLKFGGKSLETKEKFDKICKFIKSIYETEKQIIVVVSAIGDTTNKLISMSEEFGKNESSNRELSILLSTGETQSSSLFAMNLLSIGVPAKSFSGRDIGLTTFGDYNNGKVAYLNKQILQDCINKNIVAVVAGFQGINSNGEITTLGRGGSDTTAVAIATIFEVPAEIYSDYNGIFAGDPQKNNYKKFNSINFDTMISMASSGAKVLDQRATSLAKNFNTTILAKSSAYPKQSGTIVSSLESDNTAICIKENLCKISIIFSNEKKIKNILDNVFFTLNNYNYYNLTINKNNIEFLVEQEKSAKISNEISYKLNLINITK